MGNRANIKVEPCNAYWGGEDLGFLDGEIEISSEESGADITAHQEGSNVIDMIRTGKNVEVTMTLKETHAGQFQRIFGTGGAQAVAVEEITDISCVADVAGSLNNKYFLINTALDAIEYYVWMNVNTAGTDPAVSGKTGVEIALATAATASDVATAVAAALQALPGFSASASSEVVTVTNAAVGGATDAVDVDSGFDIAVSQQGMSAVYGWGNSKDFTGVSEDAQKLVLHPIVLPVSDMTRDFAFWKAYPKPDSITLSGEDPEVFSISFSVYPDYERDQSVRLFVLGSHL